ncbi:MAG: hypothetical protein LBP22_11770 [Deltaproteobacteria bacterium]|nr:hypothetical protein [Deltaproteobacteria bacterium]
MSRVTINKGIEELEAGVEPLEPGRQHRPGAGRPLLESLDLTLETHLLALVEENSKGDPEIPKLWTVKSTRNLTAELQKLGRQASHVTVGKLLKQKIFYQAFSGVIKAMRLCI